MEENRALLNAIVERLGIDISPLVESTREIITTIRETVGALNAAIEAVNAFPFVSLPTAELDRLDRLAQDLADLQTQVQDLRTRIDQRRGEIIQGTVTIVTVPTSQVISALDTTQASVSAYNQQIDVLQERLYNFQLTIGKWLTGIALLITLILLWSAFSQVWLFLQSWRLYSSQESLTTKE